MCGHYNILNWKRLAWKPTEYNNILHTHTHTHIRTHTHTHTPAWKLGKWYKHLFYSRRHLKDKHFKNVQCYYKFCKCTQISHYLPNLECKYLRVWQYQVTRMWTARPLYSTNRGINGGNHVVKLNVLKLCDIAIILVVYYLKKLTQI